VPHHEKRNALLFILGEGIWGFQAALIAPMTVLTVLLCEYGAGEYMLGSISSIERGLVLLPQILGAYLFASAHQRRQQLVRWHFLYIIPFTFLSGSILLFADQLSPAAVRWGLLLSFGGYIIATGIIVGVWLDWIALLFRPQIRGTVMGLSYFGFSLTGSVAGLVAGWILERYPGPEAYAWLYLSAGVIACLSMILFWLVKGALDVPVTMQHRRDAKAVLSCFRLSLVDSNFRHFLFGRFLGSLGFSMVPFVAVYYQSAVGGSLNNSSIVACGAALTFGMAVANLTLGRLGDAHGHRIGIVIGTFAQLLTLATLLMSRGTLSCLLAYFGVGISTSGAFLSHSNMLLETCPHENRMAHVAVGNLLVSLPLIVAPMLAGTFAQAWGIRPLFGWSFFISLISIIWLLLFVKEPRRMQVFVQET